ncbi:TIGR02266 family protein [Pyxidicoccus xibeiensis]|uniref:TIGR02266 family protein n=1 Tax=Pyxidicoccus xibeiensis TaxID=2906759 RepID=UPI0020A82034|nr:TIGR02266 family protein [Pyxidicoccus xibeiensis]MCP3137330.1 TIGR02266 family protein [Pyxidicoccus xibeiensis]
MTTKAADDMAGGDLSAFANRRTDERVTARFEVRFEQTQDAARALRAYSINISAGGLCLRTRKAYDVGSQVRLSMVIEGEEFHLAGIVAWVRDEAEAIGVRFTDMNDEDRARLQRVVDSFKR